MTSNQFLDVNVNKGSLPDAGDVTVKDSEKKVSSGSDEAQVSSDTNFSKAWTKYVKKIHVPMMVGIQFATQGAARRPNLTILSVIFLSLALVVIGMLTNFNVDVDEDILWTPMGSKPLEHMYWIEDESGYAVEPRTFFLFFHANGDSVLGEEQVGRVFEAVDAVRNLKGYDEVCQDGEESYVNEDGSTERTCKTDGIVRFWNSSTSLFESTSRSDFYTTLTMSAPVFPDGTPIPEHSIFGYPERYNETGTLSSVLSYSVFIHLPETEKAEEFELEAVDAVLSLNDKWAQSNNSTFFRVECQAAGSFSEEFTRAILSDIPLLPIVFIIMTVFTCLVCAKRHKVYSRSLLGFTAVLTVLLALLSGFGLLFIIGTPFTSMTQILPFIIFGIGVDNTFIIMGAYERTDTTKSPEERMSITMNEVGITMTTTTITTITAFGLGCTSSIPAVYWLCLYAFPTIGILYCYQLTFFVACVILDQRRIMARRRDCCFCIKANELDGEDDKDASGSESHRSMDRFVLGYADILLRPWVKVIVLIIFTVTLALCGWSTSKLSQAFKFTDVLPKDSYVTDFQESFELYTARRGVQPAIYFRDVDQSDVEIQAQMRNFVKDVVSMNSVLAEPDYFWLNDFEEFVKSGNMDQLDFNQQVDAFLSDSIYYALYNEDIVRDDAGNVITTRCWFHMDNLDIEDITQQIDALAEEEKVTASQPINSGKSSYPFFTFDGIYNIWEFYTVSVDELIMNTVLGVVAVSAAALVLIPHWSAVFFVLPMVCILYVDVLGFLQWRGVYINAVSYISLVMCIGLVVDFVMHVILRYFENTGNRREKTVEMLRTMGESILIGGISTFLGTLPLAFSSSEIFKTIFYCFLGLVLFGVSHALIVLPVVLSILGPEEQIDLRVRKAPKRMETSMSTTNHENFNESIDT